MTGSRMENKRQVVSIRFDAQGNGTPIKAAELALEYMAKQFGNRCDPRWFTRLWAVIENGENGLACIGVSGMAQVYDVSLMHMDDQHARKLLMGHMMPVLSELLPLGACVTLFVDPQTGEKWSDLLNRLDAKPAHRWLVPIGKRLEEM